MNFNKVKLKHFILILFLLGSVSFVFLFYIFNEMKAYKIVKYEDSIPPIYLKGSEGFGSLRGSVFYEPNRFVGSEILIKAICNPDILKQYNISYKTLKTLSHNTNFRIFELDLPYTLSKNANSDIIIIKKDSCVFYFKMYEYEGPYK